MCLITKQVDPSIAAEDITVYKILISAETGVTSIYQKFKYELNVLHKTNIWDIQEPCCFDDKSSVHMQKTYTDWGTLNLDDAKKLLKENSLMSYGPGFHACTTLERCYPIANDYAVYQCTIPKGSEYYEDGDDLIVSNQIIINTQLADNSVKYETPTLDE